MPPLQGFDPLPTQRVPLCTILRYPFWETDPKIFLKAPLAPIYTNFQGGARAQKTRFFRQNFPMRKCRQNFSKNFLFGLVFSKLCLRRRKIGQNRVFLLLWKSLENQFDRSKKKSTEFSEIFESLPPLEKILDPPLFTVFIYRGGDLK